MVTKSISGAFFFSRGLKLTTREDLQSNNEPRQLAALLQVIANMTIGRDMSGFFNEITALISSSNITIKRLVYLYFNQNCRAHPEKSILQLGSLTKDTFHDSPLIRATALRIMSSLQISIIGDVVTTTLIRCLEDQDPYVRSVAAAAVLKHYTITHLVSFDYALIEKLKELLYDANAMVCGMCVQTLLELDRRHVSPNLLKAISDARPHLLTMLDQATEWPRYYILQGISASFKYALSDLRSSASTHPRNSIEYDAFVREGNEVVARVLPFFYASNSATVIAAVKVVFSFLTVTTEHDRELSHTYPDLLRQRSVELIINVLICLANAPRYEIQYLTLKSIRFFLSTRFMSLLATYLGVFFAHDDDPIYIKIAKLDVLVGLSNETNGERILEELTLYTTDADVEFSSKSIQSIGALAITIPSLAPACVKRLEELIQIKNPHIVENCAIVAQKVLREYPDQFLKIIPTLYESLDLLGQADARTAFAWIVGEYADKVPHAISYLQNFVDAYKEQPLKVQLAVLTALVKMQVRGVGKELAGELLEKLEYILTWCTKQAQPDLRDRAYYYWRMLSIDIVTARELLGQVQKAPLQISSISYDQKSGPYLFEELGSLESVIHEPIQRMVGKSTLSLDLDTRHRYFSSPSDDEESDDNETKDSQEKSRIAHQMQEPGSDLFVEDQEGERKQQEVDTVSFIGGSDDFFSVRPASGDLSAVEYKPTSGLYERFVEPIMTRSAIRTARIANYDVVLPAEAAGGVEVALRWSQLGVKLVLNCRVCLRRGDDYVRRARLTDLQINRNLFSLGVQHVFPTMSLEAEEKSKEVSLIVCCNNERKPTRNLEVALEIKPVGVRYVLAPPVPPVMLLLPATGCSMVDFLRWWKEIPDPTWRMPSCALGKCEKRRFTPNALRVHCINLVYHKELNACGLTAFFLHAETIGRERLLVDVTVYREQLLFLTVRCIYPPIAAFWGEYIKRSICSYPRESLN